MNRITHHQRFLTLNKISPADLPEPIRRKLKNYHLLESMLSDTVGEDRERVEERLKRLDLELSEDLFDEFFEDSFEKPLSDQTLKRDKRQLSGDELILMGLWNEGVRTNIPRSLFIRKGIKTSIQGPNIPIGSFRIVKTGVFTHNYRLERNS